MPAIPEDAAAPRSNPTALQSSAAQAEPGFLCEELLPPLRREAFLLRCSNKKKEKDATDFLKKSRLPVCVKN
jgi:hypothetical protein